MVRGHFSDGETSKLLDASLEVVGATVLLRDEQGAVLYQCPRAKISVSSRLDNTPRRINLDADRGRHRFETNDNDSIDQLFQVDLGTSSWLHKLETNLALIAGASIFTVAFTFWLVVYGLPQGASALAHSLPDKLIGQMGERTLDILDQTHFEPSELSLAEQQRVYNALAPHILNGNTSLHFRSWPPNAMALADGSIIFTDELIRLAENDEELIAIAYHELGHVEHRHLVRRVVQGSAIAVLLFLLTGDINDVDIMISLPTALVDLAYSREFETEADLFALQAMTENGIDPEHFYNIMVKLEAWYGPDASTADPSLSKPAEDEEAGDFLRYLSTHPQSAERLATIKAYVKSN
jgi:Zn-dependent protease with chaperone function